MRKERKMKHSYKLLIILSFTKALFSSFDFNTYVFHDDVKPKDYQYQALGLPIGEKSLKKVSAAYKKLSIKHHPDKGGNSDVFQKINHAYKNITEWINFEIDEKDPEYIAAQQENQETTEQKQARQRAEIPKMNEAQIKAIPLSQIEEFTIDDVELLASIEALTIPQTQALNPSIIPDLSYDIANFRPDQIRFLTPAQVAAITADQILFLDREQIQNLDIESIPVTTLTRLAANKTARKTEQLTSRQISSLNSDQIYALLNLLTKDQIDAITSEQLRSLKAFQKDELKWRKELLERRIQEKERAMRLKQEQERSEQELIRAQIELEATRIRAEQEREQERLRKETEKQKEFAIQALELTTHLQR